MVIIRATDDDGEEEEEDEEEEESPWTLQKLADLESQAEGLPRGEVLFIRPGNDTEIKTRAWCESNGFWEVAEGVYSGDWFELAEDEEEGWEEDDEEDDEDEADVLRNLDFRRLGFDAAEAAIFNNLVPGLKAEFAKDALQRQDAGRVDIAGEAAQAYIAQLRSADEDERADILLGNLRSFDLANNFRCMLQAFGVSPSARFPDEDFPQKPDVAGPAADGTPLLHYAARYGAEKCVAALLAGGADVAAVDSFNSTALHQAAVNEQVGIVTQLLQARAPLETACTMDPEEEQELTALHCAAAMSTAEVVRALLAAGAVVDARSAKQETPLHAAAAMAELESARALVEAGAALDAVDCDGNTPAMAAAENLVQPNSSEFDELFELLGGRPGGGTG